MTLWIALEGDAPVDFQRGTGTVIGDIEGPCAGVLSFDGEAWGHFLQGACAGDVSAAPDGSVWVVVDALRTNDSSEVAATASGLYVITPEAVAAAE